MRLRLAGLFLLVLTALLLSVSARSTGPPPDTVKNNDGCTCHGSANTATVIHDLAGWPTAYVPGQTYLLELSSTNNLQIQPQLTKNQGGFLVWVTDGALTTTPGTQAWIDVGKMSSGEDWARHNIQGETENGQQKWSFTWIAPAAGEGTVTIHTYVNRINSDQTSGGDHWNKRQFTSTEGTGSATSAPTGTTTSPAGPTSTDPTTSAASGTKGTSAASEPAPGFILGAAVVLAAAVVTRRRFT